MNFGSGASGTAVPLRAMTGGTTTIRGNKEGIRVVVTGKGGVGKTTLVALLSHLFAREGLRVLAVDGDPQKNLAVTLGIAPNEAKQIVPVCRSPDYIREKTGASPDLSPGGLLTLNPDVGDVVDRFSVRVAPNLRLLVMGGVKQAGTGCLCPEYTLLSSILRNIRLFSDEVILLDTPAGLEHFGRAVADGFSTAIVMADPSYNALSVARESADLARQLGIGQVVFVVNRAAGQEDEGKIGRKVQELEEFSRLFYLPFNQEVLRIEPEVSGLLEQKSPFVNNLRILAAAITGQVDLVSSGFH
ncbi:MAG: AAA family ATPase [Methanoregula sp.]|nr:MAG: AAA family ATPase [Methanoregula sp.]